MFKSIPTPISQGNGLPAGAGAGPREVGGWLLTKCHLFILLLRLPTPDSPEGGRTQAWVLAGTRGSVGAASAGHWPVRATPRFGVSRAGHLGVLGHSGFHPQPSHVNGQGLSTQVTHTQPGPAFAHC